MRLLKRDLYLERLEEMYQSDRFEFYPIYGRRRVGKTTLIKEFISGKKSIQCFGISRGEQANLESLYAAVRSVFYEDFKDETLNPEPSFLSLLRLVFEKSQHEKLILFIDEYPDMVRSHPALHGELRNLIDEYQDRSKLKLILCGSSISFMVDEVLAYKAPLYGRRTGHLKILPFTFAETCSYLEGCPALEKALWYGILGGTPFYLSMLDPKKSFEDNLSDLLLKPNAFLADEPFNLLRQELREPQVYADILTAIAQGASRQIDIANKCRLQSNAASVYLKTLVELNLIEKEHPFGAAAANKVIYKIEDNFFRFYHRYFPKVERAVFNGKPDSALKFIMNDLSDFMGEVFEKICREYVWQRSRAGELPVDILDLGRWWGTDSRSKSQCEIDILASDLIDGAIFGECKWTNAKIDEGVLQRLEDKSRLFSYRNVHFMLFAKSGFTKGCLELAKKMGNVELVTCEKLLDKLPKSEILDTVANPFRYTRQKDHCRDS